MRRFLYGFLSLILVFSCTACSSGRPPQSENQTAVYYLDPQETHLTPEYILSPTGETKDLVQVLVDRMKQTASTERVPVLPEDAGVTSLELSGNILSLDLSGSFDLTKNAKRILTYAALTRTLIQIPDVYGLRLSINGEPAADGSGDPMGILRAASFADNAADDPGDYVRTRITLYFANDRMTRLVETSRTVSYKSTASLERIIVEQLIAGAEEGAGTNVLPATASLLGINVRDGICYVNLDEKFLSDSLVSSQELPVYAIVNSLTSLENISQVQISINGAADAIPPSGNVNLSAPLEFNGDLIE